MVQGVNPYDLTAVDWGMGSIPEVMPKNFNNRTYLRLVEKEEITPQGVVM